MPTIIPTIDHNTWLRAKFDDYCLLVKHKLNITVVFSSLIGYLMAIGTAANIYHVVCLSLFGFMVTGAANALNQIFEKDYDRQMKRTANRPLAAGRMGNTEALLVAGIMGIGGISGLWYVFNDLAALTGALSLLSYAFIYTPLKRISPIAVLVGAFPGALPPAIGWVAATASFGYEAWVLFSIQFLWQFPHFWAIGWLGAEEYEKAGFKLYPSTRDRNQHTALQAILYIVALTTTTLLPVFAGWWSYYFGAIALVLGGIFAYYGIRLFRQCNNQAALQLMFASIGYLVVLQIAMVLDRIL
ncbi:MAG: protoheme IX farnesyltransferase [Sphingobacteriales bacterium]|nr:protoheme IX farnesyltransferase [Sphingobacteriales bacterium]MCC7223315.1 protoheme IX farnesyltransferase [Chitinophagales bacterium]